MRTAFRQFPTASLPETKADPIGFFEAVAMAGLEGQFVRIPAAVQRRHFGAVPFGKLGVRVANDGAVTTLRSVAFGRDYDEQTARWSQVDRQWFQADGHMTENFPR